MARVKIKELRLRNFRAFENARFVLDDKLTVVIGRNGSGKSTLMEAFEFMRDALFDGLVTAIAKHGGLPTISRQLPLLRNPSNVSLAIVLELEGQEVIYGFTIGPIPSELPFNMRGFSSWWVTEETLTSSSKTSYFLRRGDNFDTDIVGIAPAPAQQALILPQIANAAKIWDEVLDALRRTYIYKISPAAIRQEHKVGGITWLNPEGSNASDVLDMLQYKARKEGSLDIKWITEHLSGFAGGVEGIGANTSQTGLRTMEFIQKANGSFNIFTAAQMSDGTLRALGILLALRQEPTPTLVFFDEIEDSIHPDALGVILDAIETSTERMQIVITSHNTDLLERNIISADEVRVVEWDNGVSAIHNLSENMIKAIDGPYENVLEDNQAPYTVGELLRYNALSADEAPVQVEGAFFEVPR